MKRLLSLLILLLVAVLIILIGSYYRAKMAKNSNSNQTESLAPVTSSGNNSTGQTAPVQIQNNAQSGSTTQGSAVLVPPIGRFNERASKNFFGSYYSFSNKQNLDTSVCKQATAYTGYHTGVDLEIFSSELNSEVPVDAVADGIVRQIGSVSGYGGLIVIDHLINSQTYTAYYGHVDITISNLKTGDKVKVGQRITNLAPECSSKNGFNRKHLHFGLHKESTIVVSGYVATTSKLSNWVDPMTIIK
jgi:murein DD-endopeptidase MepM/ murein hydrolase activator NlpD